MIRVDAVALEVDLSRFSVWLQARGVDHRVVEENGLQVIYIEADDMAGQVKMALERYLVDPNVHSQLDHWVAENEHLMHTVSDVSVMHQPYFRAKPSQAPVIFLMIGLSVLVAFLTNFGQVGSFLRDLWIIDPYKLNINLSSAEGRWVGLLTTLAQGEYWRLISPDFIHFNVLHITFNALMLWVLGGQLEKQKGSWSFLALVLFVSIVSNIAQLLDSHNFFGGMSGVVYGLVGYCWLWRYFQPTIFFPDALLKFTLVWLMLGYTPLTEWMGLGKMANAAHLYGLIAGLLWGAITLFVNEKILNKKS